MTHLGTHFFSQQAGSVWGGGGKIDQGGGVKFGGGGEGSKIAKIYTFFVQSKNAKNYRFSVGRIN